MYLSVLAMDSFDVRLRAIAVLLVGGLLGGCGDGAAESGPRAADPATQSAAPRRPPSWEDSCVARLRAKEAQARQQPDTTLPPGWPVPGPPRRPGSLLPCYRIVAFYGNPFSKRMGILGELPPDQMLARLDQEVRAWERADPSTPVKPALHLVTVVAQGDPGRDGMYRVVMPDSIVQLVLDWAKRRDALVFLDLQVGLSTVPAELPKVLKWLRLPHVHLALDPEFAMRTKGVPPGRRIGTLDAQDINYAIDVLADLVEREHLPPKILIVHRFTRGMITNARQIRLDPRVQVVINMDGWGPPWLKRDSYQDYVAAEPVQFTGFKLFYKNDTKKGHPLMTPEEVLKLRPQPIYIQYQ